MDQTSDIDDAFAQIMAKRQAPPAPAAAAPAPRVVDMDGTDLGEHSDTGPDLREPEPAALGVDPKNPGQPDGRTGAQVDQLLTSEGAGAAGPTESTAQMVERLVPHPRDEADDAMDQVLADRKRRQDAAASFLAWKANRPGVDPATQLEVLRLSDDAGLPADFVANNLDQVRKQVGDRDNAAEWNALVKTSPELAQWADENPARPPAIRDNLDDLSMLGWALQGPTTALADGVKDLWSSARKFADATGLGGAENEKKIQELEAEQQNHGDYGAHNFFTKGMVGLAKTAPLLLLDQGVRFLAGAGAGRLLGLGGAAAAEVAGLGPEDPAADVGAGLSLVGGERLAQEGGSFLLNSALSYANTNYELKKIVGPDGKPLDPEVRQVLAAGVGVLNGGIMAVAGVGGHLLGPGAEAIDKDVLNREGLEAAKRLLMDPGKMATLQRFVRRFGVHGASALIVGGAQAGISDVANQTAQVKAGQSKGFSLGELMDTAWAGSWKTANDMMLLSGFNAAMETRTDVGNAATARALLEQRGREVATTQSAARLAQINQAAQGKTVQGLSQKGVADLVRKLGNQQVIIDQGAVKKLAAERGVDPEDLGKQIAGDDGKAWADAQRTGGELVAQAPGYIDFARKDGAGAQALFHDSKLNTDALTPREHAEREAAFQRRAAELAKAPAESLEESPRRVYDDFRTKAIFAGHDPVEADANARLVAAAAQTWAEEFAKSTAQAHDAWGVYNAQDLRITGPDGRSIGIGDFSKGTKLQAGPPDHEAVADVRAKYEKQLNEPGQEKAMRAFFTDPVTGLRNERAAEQATTDKPQVLHFGVEGIKFRNDDLKVGGHNKADELFRAVAQAAHKVSPDTYRAGGDFAVPVKDQAEADAFLEQVRKNLPKTAKGYGITGAVGEAGVDEKGEQVDALTAARTAHDKLKEGMEQRGERVVRGERPKGLPEGEDAGTHIAAARVKAELGEEHRQRFGALTSTRAGRDEAFATVHVEHGTGILTRQGFDARPQKKYRAAIDLNGLKRVQEKLALHMSKEDAHAFGDEMLRQFGNLVRQSRGLDFDFAHDHGDEYLAQSDDDGELKQFLEKVRDLARLVEVRVEATKDGVAGEWRYKKLMFGFGTGEASNENAAERALNADKLQLSKQGERGNEDQPGRLDFVPGGSDGGREADGEAGTVDRGDQGPLGGHDRGRAGSGAGAGAGEDRPGTNGAGPGGEAGQGEGRGGATPEGGGRGVDASSALSQPRFALDSRPGRGRIEYTPPGGGTRRTFDIKILAKADKSTLAHETFHFLNQVLGDLAQRPDAPDRIKEDYAKLLKFGGYADHAQRVAESAERAELDARVEKGHKLTATKQARLTELHAKEERLTHAWEQYLVEGKAPSADLVGTFGRFRGWLTDIYRKVTGADGSAAAGIQAQFRRTYGEEIGLNDEVRGIFDRVLTSDAEVKRAQAAEESTRPWDELAAKMTPDEKKAYQERATKAADFARTEVTRRLAENAHEDNVGFFKRERQRLRDEAESDLDKDPVYRAISYLQDGELPGGTPEALKDDKGEPFKLDRDALRRRYDAETVRALPRGIFAPKGEKGASADDLAELLGFQDGKDLVAKLLKAQPRKQVVEARVNERMESLHGPALKDAPQALQDQAHDALHNEDALQKVLMERRKLMELVAPGKAGHAMDLSPEYLKRTAEELVAGKETGALTKGRDGLAGYYLRAERTATQRMRKAFEAGQYEDALIQNERVLVNMHLYRAARDARERLELAENALQQSAEEPWRTALGKADVAATPEGKDNDHAFLGAHDAILQAINMMPAQGAPDLGSIDRLRAAIGDGGIGFDVQGLQDLVAHPTPWADLTVTQAENVLAAVKNIRHAANAQLQFELTGKQMDRAEWFAQAQQHALKTAQLGPRALTSSGQTIPEWISSAIRGGDAWLTSVHTYVDTLDGGDRDGPWHRLFVDEYREARQKLVELDRDIVGKVRAAIEKMPKAMRARANERVPGLADLLPPDPRYGDRVRGAETRSDLWSLFLNSGNEDNLQRLRDGNGWTDDARQQALQLLSPEEARFLQGLLDAIDSLHPELAKAYKRRKGLSLGKVKATPIIINGETFRGGYFPIRYDPSISRQGAVQMADVEKALFPAGYSSPTVYSGHTKERMDVVLAPLSMEFGTTQSHLAQVVQDIAMGDFVRKAGSMVLDQRFAPIVDKALGQERTKLFMPLLKDIAADRAGSTMAAAEGQPGFIRALMAAGRSRYARGVMALNLPSMLAHLTDPLAAIGDAQGFGMAERALRLAPAYGKVIASWKTGPRDEWKLSKELAYRDARETANIRKELERVKLPENVFLRGVAHVSDVADHVSTLARHYLDMHHSQVLWQVGYDEALAKGSTQEEAARAGDDLLAKTLPSGDMAEKSAIMRSKHDLAAVVTFYGYANRMYNLWVHAPISRAVDAWTGPDSSPMSKLRSAGDLASKWIVMGAVAALGAKLAGRGSDADDDKKALLLRNSGWAGWAARRMLLEPANTIPIVGPVFEQIADGKQVSVRTAPAAEVISDTGNRLEKAIEKARDDGSYSRLVWELLDLTTGTVIGATGQLQRTAGYIHDAAAGDLTPQGPSDVGKGIIYGPPHAQR